MMAAMTHENSSNQDRRNFWRDRMDAAFDFMTQIMDQPVRECREPLADLKAAAAQADIEVAFSATKLDETCERLYYLRQGLLEPFLGAAQELNQRGWILKVEDAYRSLNMQRRLGRNPRIFQTILKRVVWELNGQAVDADFFFRRLTAMVATCPQIGTHTSASALDISVLNRRDHTEIDRGAPYLEMSELTPMDCPFISSSAQHNRQEITNLMARHGFTAYPYEFWHYSSGDVYDRYIHHRVEPARYGPVNSSPPYAHVEPIDNPKTSLHEPAEIRRTIENILAG